MKTNLKKNNKLYLIGIILLFLNGFVMSINAQESTLSKEIQAQTATVYVCPMHADVSSKVPGKCPKCSMVLIAAGAGEDQQFYACPMHADVMSTKEGKCPKCQMALVKMSAPEAGDFDLKIETTPKVIKAGKPLNLRFSVFNPKTGKQVTEFNILHDMPFHLFVVSRDFSHFDHIHPTKQKDSSFTIETILPKPGYIKSTAIYFLSVACRKSFIKI